MNNLQEEPKNKGGRPKTSLHEKALRGTLQPFQIPKRPPREPKATPVPPRDYLALADRYAADVLAGRITTCVWVRRAVARHVRDVQRAQDETWPYVWSPTHAVAPCAFLEQLPHVQGRWGSATLTLEPWQVFVVTCLFGWRQRHNLHARRFTLLYLELGRKGAKSTLMAGLALFHLLREDEPGATVVCGATTGSQARIVFGIAQQMVWRSPWLKRQKLEALAHAIVKGKPRQARGSMKPINAKASTQDGLNPSCIVLDESHAQKFPLHDVLKSAQGARPNPLMLCPTTAGYDLLSVGYALRTTVTKVLEGVIDAEHVLGLIYTIDDGDDWRDERVWIKANPMLGVTPTVEWMRRYCLDAQQTPGLEAEFRVKCCSEWANAAATWLSMAAWDRCADPTLVLERFAGAPCWIGADLAQVDDLAAVALVFERDGLLYGFVRCYLPELVVQERARAVPEYRRWADAGVLVLTEGNMIDHARIEADIRDACQRFAVREIVLDMFGAWQITGNLSNSGLPARAEQKNAKTATPAARELEARVTHCRFRHDGNTCLKWQASNVVVSRRVDDTLLPKKEHAESPNKIDAIDALILGIGAWLKTAATPNYDLMVVG